MSQAERIAGVQTSAVFYISPKSAIFRQKQRLLKLICEKAAKESVSEPTYFNRVYLGKLLGISGLYGRIKTHQHGTNIGTSLEQFLQKFGFSSDEARAQIDQTIAAFVEELQMSSDRRLGINNDNHRFAHVGFHRTGTHIFQELAIIIAEAISDYPSSALVVQLSKAITKAYPAMSTIRKEMLAREVSNKKIESMFASCFGEVRSGPEANQIDASVLQSMITSCMSEVRSILEDYNKNNSETESQIAFSLNNIRSALKRHHGNYAEIENKFTSCLGEIKSELQRYRINKTEIESRVASSLAGVRVLLKEYQVTDTEIEKHIEHAAKGLAEFLLNDKNAPGLSV